MILSGDVVSFEGDTIKAGAGDSNSILTTLNRHNAVHSAQISRGRLAWRLQLSHNRRMENRRNYYRILHVQRDAPVEIIKTSYRTMMQRLRMHPDLGGDHWTATVINEAYATLIDPDKRAAYDRALFASANETHGQAQEPAAGSRPQNPSTDSSARNSSGRHAHETGAGHCDFCGAPHPLYKLERDTTCHRCESPLSPAEHDRHDDQTRRAVMRMPKSFPLRFVTGWPSRQLLNGCALDLSISGLRFVCDEFVPAGTLISIDSDICSAVARVRDCSAAGPGSAGDFEVGVQFVTLRFHRTQGGFVSVTA